MLNLSDMRLKAIKSPEISVHDLYRPIGAAGLTKCARNTIRHDRFGWSSCNSTPDQLSEQTCIVCVPHQETKDLLVVTSQPKIEAPIRHGVISIAVGVVVFVVSLIFFCLACGLNFQDEGWSVATKNDSGVAWNSSGLVVSSLGFLLSAVFFFWGVVRVSRQPERK